MRHVVRTFYGGSHNAFNKVGLESVPSCIILAPIINLNLGLKIHVSRYITIPAYLNDSIFAYDSGIQSCTAKFNPK